MNIAIFGYGKMGKKIFEHAQKRGHDVIIKSNSKNPANQTDLSNIDVVIEFSTPEKAFENISYALSKNTPVICGTTNWLEHLNKIQDLCTKNNGAFLYASNFSIGVNIFFEINKILAAKMKDLDYQISISEIHHKEKLDSPSGTAKSILNDIKEINNLAEINIDSQRVNNNIGTHEVKYSSTIDNITFKHEANNRDGFALGALLAAEWIINKKGIFTFADVLKSLYK